METEILQKSRKNGCECPPHTLQVLAWFLVFYLAILEFALVIPSFNSIITRLSLYGVMGLLIGMLFCVNVILTAIDPGDDSVRKKVRNRNQPEFDRNKHAHVIDDNYYCNICEEVVHPTSKHCRQCNKCILDFDHHCKWLNNCVGARNYKWFIVYIGSSVLASGCIALQAITALVLYFAKPATLKKTEENLHMFGACVPNGVWIGFLLSTVVVALVVCILTGHLLFFHIRLIKRGITTYNFIMKQKQRNEEKTKQKSENRDQTSNFQSNGWIGPGPEPGRLASHSATKASSTKNANAQRKLNNEPTHQPHASQVPKLPPINLNSGKNPKVQKTKIKTIDSTVPYSQMQNDGTTTPDSVKTNISDVQENVPSGKITASTGVNVTLSHNDFSSSSQQVVELPPVPQTGGSKTITKLYEPNVETVLISEQRELTLPSILVASPPSDSEAMNDDSMTEIPLSTFRKSSAGGASGVLTNSANFPPGSTVYIASGQFTVAKITTPRKNDKNTAISSGPPIIHKEMSKNRVDKGVGCGPKKISRNAVSHFSDSIDSSRECEENCGKKRVHFSQDSTDCRKIKL